MGEAVGDLLPLALGVAISPVPVIAVILMLLSPRAGRTGTGFLAGWVAGIAVATGALAALAGAIGLSSDGSPSGPVSWIRICLGGLLLVLAVHQWRGRPRAGEAAELPSWMKAVDTMTPVRALALGLLLSAANPKNLMMCAGAGVAIAQGDAGAGGAVLAVALFTVIGAASVAAPVLGYLAAADRMRAPLDELKAWLQQNSATVMFVLLLVLGTVLVGKGLGGLLG